MVSHLGTGEFGSVSKGLWTSESGVVEVAVKTLTDSANTVKFLQEAAIMAQFRHPNILTLHGVVSAGHPVSITIHTFTNFSQKMIVMELMHNGNLKDFLIKLRPE